MSSPATFRGRNIVKLGQKGYPGVYWPEHPCALSNGMTYVHRIVAHEKFGPIPKSHHVHHVDEDHWNWSPENLELVTPAEHLRLHLHQRNGTKRETTCDWCGSRFKRYPSEMKDSNYCSISCAAYGTNKTKAEWPPTEVLERMVEATSYCAVGRQLGVSDNAVRKRIRNHPA